MPTTRVLIEEVDGRDPANPFNRVVEVELPDGYYRVWEGALVPGDLYLSRYAALDGLTVWEPVELEDIPGAPRPSADCYDCLIRKGTEVVPACERCGVFGRGRGLRYCLSCAPIVGGKIRER